eukprot:7084747-Prymnesium_polylepis.1
MAHRAGAAQHDQVDAVAQQRREELGRRVSHVQHHTAAAQQRTQPRRITEARQREGVSIVAGDVQGQLAALGRARLAEVVAAVVLLDAVERRRDIVHGKPRPCLRRRSIDQRAQIGARAPVRKAATEEGARFARSPGGSRGGLSELALHLARWRCVLPAGPSELGHGQPSAPRVVGIGEYG